MSTSVIRVMPKNTAEFTAMRWSPGENDDDLEWMANQYGWRLGETKDDGKRVSQVIFGRSRKRYIIFSGEWVIALGSNGSLRVMNDTEFHDTYTEV